MSGSLTADVAERQFLRSQYFRELCPSRGRSQLTGHPIAKNLRGRVVPADFRGQIQQTGQVRSELRRSQQQTAMLQDGTSATTLGTAQNFVSLNHQVGGSMTQK